MIPAKRGLFIRGWHLLLNVGVDPADDEYLRTVKRIYWVSSFIGLLTAFSSTAWYFLTGHPAIGWLFLGSSAFFLVLFVEGARHPRHFRLVVSALLAYFVAGSVLATIFMGGFWKTNGGIMAGLLGPVLGLVFLRDRRPAVLLFIGYCAAVVTLAVIRAPLESRPGIDFTRFWLAYVIICGFIFGVTYFFVIQRDRAHRELAAEKAKSESLLRRIEADLAEAARIQKELLPKENARLPGYDLGGLNVSCYEVGGDYFDFVPIDEHRMGVVIADVSGKGISASLLMASLRAALLAEVRPDYDLALTASRLNQFVAKSSGPSSFVTFAFVELDSRVGEIRHVNAGHNPPFILGSDGQPRPLASTGFPLGMFPFSTYEVRTSPFGQGELAVLYTDGIPEDQDPSGRDYSEARLVDVVRANRGLAADEICRKVYGDVRSFESGCPPRDDITLVVIKRAPFAAALADKPEGQR